MMCRTIKKSAMPGLIREVAGGAEFYGPVRVDGTVMLAAVTDGDELVYDYTNTQMPVKRMFFPLEETISTRTKGDTAAAPVPAEKRVLFGVRPCDAASLTALDKVFLDTDYPDPFYKARRANSVVLALACGELHAQCFCTGVDGRPDGVDGADILVRDQGSDLRFEAVSPVGEKFIEAHASLFAPADEGDTPAPQTGDTVLDVPMEGIEAKLNSVFDSAAWTRIAERCLSCGTCTYLCPTCHCFAIYDEGDAAEGARIRVHDGCQYAAFTSEASGHNPRPTPAERMRQRVMHKFCYTRENFGRTFCTGCGRCVAHCPVNVDIRETLAEVVA